MNFIKKNYEKILLGAVLLGLVVFLLLLPIIIRHDEQASEDIANSIIHHTPKPLPALDLSSESDALARVQSPYALDFETTNRLFNPVLWQKTPDGRLIKVANGNEIGPNAVVVTKISPLYFILKLDSIEPSNQFSAARYVISVEQQAAVMPMQRRPREHYISVGEKNDVFALLQAKGAPDNPQLILQLADSGEMVTISKNKSFRRVDGYMADLKYDPESKRWDGQRVGADLKFYGGDYIIVAIDPTEVVLSAESNQKKTTLKYQP